MYPESLYFFKQLEILLSAHTYYTHIVFDYKDWHFPVLRYDHRPDSSRIMIDDYAEKSPFLATDSK